MRDTTLESAAAQLKLLDPYAEFCARSSSLARLAARESVLRYPTHEQVADRA